MASARRKTTIEERKEIVKYCIEHNRDYKRTASNYDVLIDTAIAEGYIKAEDKDRLIAFRNNPSDESWIK